MYRQNAALARAGHVAKWGEGVALFGLFSITLALVVFWVGSLINYEPLLAQVFETADVDIEGQTLPFGTRFLAVTFWSLVDIPGWILVFTAWRMFRGFRTEGFVTTATGVRLRRIGWCVLAIVPIGILAELSSSAVLSSLVNVDGVHITFDLEDTDVYALVMGLIILATGQIMAQAVEIADENRSFI